MQSGMRKSILLLLPGRNLSKAIGGYIANMMEISYLKTLYNFL
jgi:hypothetical protein